MEANTQESTYVVPSTPAAKKAKPAKKSKPVAKKAPAKKAAKKVAPTGDRLVPADLSKYVKSNEVKTAAGNPSIDCGDKVAEKLRGTTLDEAYAVVAKACDTTVKELVGKYKHLNVGMQRMNLGNKLRGALGVAPGPKAAGKKAVKKAK